jgi:hypothetical protein
MFNAASRVQILRMRSSKRVLLKVLRRCLVCDWEGQMDEPADADEIGAPCPACQAPTERTTILGRRMALAVRNAAAAELGRLGGLKGGRARARALSPERRREIALNAIRTRWAKKKQR